MVSIFNYSKYKVNINGDVFSFTKKSNGKKLKKHNHKCGYDFVWLHSDDGKRKAMFVHRMVAIAFIKNPDNKPEVNHLDYNKKNNNANNLEWVTRSENMVHMRKEYNPSEKQIETIRQLGKKFGKINGSKVIYQDEYFDKVKPLRDKGLSYLKIAKELNMSVSTAYRLSKGVRK